MHRRRDYGSTLKIWYLFPRISVDFRVSFPWNFYRCCCFALNKTDLDRGKAIRKHPTYGLWRELTTRWRVIYYCQNVFFNLIFLCFLVFGCLSFQPFASWSMFVFFLLLLLFCLVDDAGVTRCTKGHLPTPTAHHKKQKTSNIRNIKI